MEGVSLSRGIQHKQDSLRQSFTGICGRDMREPITWEIATSIIGLASLGYCGIFAVSLDAAGAREAVKISRFRFLCYLHFLQSLAPPPHLGADGRRYIRSLVRRGATYAPFYVYDQVSLFRTLFDVGVAHVCNISLGTPHRPVGLILNAFIMLALHMCGCNDLGKHTFLFMHWGTLSKHEGNFKR